MSVLFCVLAAGPSLSQPEGSRESYLDGSDGRDWPGFGRTFGEQHYTPLTQITRTNTDRLGLAWWLDLGPGPGSTRTQPIAVNGVLYFAIGYSVVHAVDGASGRLLWRYDAKGAENAGINIRGGWGSRGIAWWNGKIYTGTEDGRLIAIDAQTGRPVWSVQTLEKDAAAAITGAPRVFDGKVIIGHGGDMGKNRGYVTAYDAESGKKLWRFYTVPGNPKEDFENHAMEMAAKTWAGEWWRYGGGGQVWNAMAYDPETDTVYIGVGGGFPANRRARSQDRGDNLFLTSIVALSGKTGDYKWHYQEVPGDSWDYDAVADIELADLTIDGRSRKVLMQAPKDGFYYVLDRLTGELISAVPYTKVTWASRIDSKTGRPVENPGVRYENGTTVTMWPGGFPRTWHPMAYSPKTHLAYFSAWEYGLTFNDKGIDVQHWPLYTDRAIDSVNGFLAADRRWPEGPHKFKSWLLAWDPVTQKARWSVPIYGGFGVIATAAGLVFQGEVAGDSSVVPANGALKAYDAESGKLLWSFDAQSPVAAPPLSYVANGQQYVSVLTGGGRQARRVLTFALDGKARLPAGLVPLPMVEDPQFKPDPVSAAAGGVIYEAHCHNCHPLGDSSWVGAPDLRRSAIPLSAEAFANIVRGGAFLPQGMPKFGEFTDEQLASLRQYIRGEAQQLRNNVGRSRQQ